jgi:single-strand DNA-binding protein
MNTTTVTGNLTRDPELQFTNGGKAVVGFGIAVTRKYNDVEQTSFFNVTAWDTLGENCAASLHKGDRVLVAGRIEVREYDKKDGTKGTSTDIVADEVGPSLRWATATVAKVKRSTSSAGGSAAFDGPPF